MRIIILLAIILLAILHFTACSETDEMTEPADAGDVVDFDSDILDEVDSLLPEPEPEPCGYPQDTGSLFYGETFPELSWLEAYGPYGNEVTIHFSDQLCGVSEENNIPHYDSIILAIGTGWCPYCPDYMRHIDSLAEELEENNAMIIYAELQTEYMASATSTWAHTYINSLGIETGYRVGDADSWPFVNFLSNTGDIVSYPTSFIIRTRDMRIVAAQRDSAYYLDFRSITAGMSED